VPASPPEWTTSELWSTVLVDGIALVCMVLMFATGSSEDLASSRRSSPRHPSS
jgi:hypothetical protein